VVNVGWTGTGLVGLKRFTAPAGSPPLSPALLRPVTMQTSGRNGRDTGSVDDVDGHHAELAFHAPYYWQAWNQDGAFTPPTPHITGIHLIY